MVMQAGKMRHQVQIHQPTATQDASGQYEESWASYATTWAEISPISGAARINANVMQSDLSHIVRLRFVPAGTSTPAVSPKHRIYDVASTRYLEIVSVIDKDQRGIELELQCKEVDS